MSLRIADNLDSRPDVDLSQQALAQAFAEFANAADSLGRTYGGLQTELVRLRQELQKSSRDLAHSLEQNQRMRAYLNRILENLPCGVLVFDAECRLRFWNAAAASCIENQHGSLADAEYAWQLFRDLDALPFGGAAEQPWVSRTPVGERHMAVTRVDLPGDTAVETDRIFILRDVTSETRAEREREASRRTQALAEMAMVLAHEIRNPLGSLELIAGLLADAVADSPETRRWSDHLLAGLRTLSATVNNVLQFHCQPVLQSRPTDLADLLRSSMEFLGPLARQRSVKIEFMRCIEEAVIRADSQRLQQVFFNLSLNAFRAMSPAGGVLRVQVRWPKSAMRDAVVVEFADEGTGIAPGDLQKIFDAGYTTAAGSPGLGLAVCKKIIEQHGGTIQVQSEPGQGAVFSVYLPANEAAA